MMTGLVDGVGRGCGLRAWFQMLFYTLLSIFEGESDSAIPKLDPRKHTLLKQTEKNRTVKSERIENERILFIAEEKVGEKMLKAKERSRKLQPKEDFQKNNVSLTKGDYV